MIIILFILLIYWLYKKLKPKYFKLWIIEVVLLWLIAYIADYIQFKNLDEMTGYFPIYSFLFGPSGTLIITLFILDFNKKK
jgi:hypothetical protein